MSTDKSRAQALLRGARQDGNTLAEEFAGSACRVALVACSYDTAFESVEAQVHEKIEQIKAVFPVDGPVDWRLWVVDDNTDQPNFTRDVERGFARHPMLDLAGYLHVMPMTTRPRRSGGFKGRALLDGMKVALDTWNADYLVYINLNLKVEVAFVAPGLLQLARGYGAAAIGTRAPERGGVTLGAGKRGRLKSRAFNVATATILPALASYRDTNAPMKIFTASAARLLIDTTGDRGVTMDCEWLMSLHANRQKVAVYPIVWKQRPGSHPPWGLVGQSLADLRDIRTRWAT